MIQQNTVLSIQLTPPDVLVNIPMNRFGDFEYNRAEKISREGKKLMKKALMDYKSQ